jgi:hypothetical protein
VNEAPEEAKSHEQDKARLIEHLRAQKPVSIVPGTREELYERRGARETTTPEHNPPAAKPGEAP